MRFMVDECTGPKVAKWLKEQGHDVFSVYESARGVGDREIIKMGHEGQYILITNDKDFGELVFRFSFPHKGIVLLRLENERFDNKIEVLRKLLDLHADRLDKNFTVVTEKSVKIVEP